MLQSYVDAPDRHACSRRSPPSPRCSANTVVLFTSDHGEYGGSHGMRGKGASAYEEAIRVPLYVRDSARPRDRRHRRARAPSSPPASTSSRCC